MSWESIKLNKCDKWKCYGAIIWPGPAIYSVRVQKLSGKCVPVDGGWSSAVVFVECHKNRTGTWIHNNNNSNRNNNNNGTDKLLCFSVCLRGLNTYSTHKFVMEIVGKFVVSILGINFTSCPPCFAWQSLLYGSITSCCHSWFVVVVVPAPMCTSAYKHYLCM